MKRKGVAVGFGCLAIVVATLGGVLRFQSISADRRQRELLAQAWAEGLPTTVAQFETYLPKVEAADNAAPFYSRMRRIGSLRGFEVEAVTRALISRRSAKDVKLAKVGLAHWSASIALAEQAVKLPHCRFDRDWKQGSAVLLPELAEMRNISRLFLLRGSLAAPTDPLRAIDNARMSLAMSRHLAEEPLPASQAIAASTETRTLNALASWTFAYPKEPRFRSELERMVSQLRAPDLHKVEASSLLDVLSLIELCETDDGLRKLGLKDPDIAEAKKWGRGMSWLQSAGKGRERIIDAMRKKWRALDLPPAQKAVIDKEAYSELDQGLQSFPIAGRLYETLSWDGSEASPERRFVLQKNAMTAFLRATASGSPANTIRTEDLIDPEDHKPLKYQFDGKRIWINSGPLKVVIPPTP